MSARGESSALVAVRDTSAAGDVVRLSVDDSASALAAGAFDFGDGVFVAGERSDSPA